MMDPKSKVTDARLSKSQSKEVKISPSLPEKKSSKATKTVPRIKNASSAICKPSSSKGILSGKHMTSLPKVPSLEIHTRNSSGYRKVTSAVCKTPVEGSMGSSADILHPQKKNVKQIRKPTEYINLSSEDSLNNAGSSECVAWLSKTPSVEMKNAGNSSGYENVTSIVCKTPGEGSTGSGTGILHLETKPNMTCTFDITPSEGSKSSTRGKGVAHADQKEMNTEDMKKCDGYVCESSPFCMLQGEDSITGKSVYDFKFDEEPVSTFSGDKSVLSTLLKSISRNSVGTGSGTGILHLETKPNMTCTLDITPSEVSKSSTRGKGVAHADQKEMSTEDMKKCDGYVCESSLFRMLQRENSITGKSGYDFKFDEEPISTFSEDKNVPSTLLKSITGNSVGTDGSGRVVLHSAQKKTWSNNFRKFEPKKPWDNSVGYRNPEKRPLSSSLCKAKSDGSINSTGSSIGMSHPHKKQWNNNYRNSGEKKNSAISVFGSEGGDSIRSTGSRASVSHPHKIPWDNNFSKFVGDKNSLCSVFRAEKENAIVITGSDVCVSCYHTKKAWRDMSANIAGYKNLLPVDETSSQMSNESAANDKTWSPFCCRGKKPAAKCKHHADSEINVPGALGTGKKVPSKVIKRKNKNIYEEPLRPVSQRDPKVAVPHHVGFEEPLRPVSLRDPEVGAPHHVGYKEPLRPVSQRDPKVGVPHGGYEEPLRPVSQRDPKVDVPHHVGYEEPLRPVSQRDPKVDVPHHVGYEEPLRPVSQRDPNAVLQHHGPYNDVPRPLCTRGIVLTIMDDSGFDKIRPMCERASTNKVKYGDDYVDIPRPMMGTRTCNLKKCQSGDAYVDQLRPMCTRASGYVKKIPPELDDRNVNKPHIFAPGLIEAVNNPDKADNSFYQFSVDIWSKTFQERRRAATRSTVFDAPGPVALPPPRKPECNPLTMVGYTQRRAPRPPAERQYRNVITGEGVGVQVKRWDPQAYIDTPPKRRFPHGDHL